MGNVFIPTSKAPCVSIEVNNTEREFILNSLTMSSKIAIGFCVVIFSVIFWSCQKTEETKSGEAILQLPAIPYVYDSVNGNNDIPTLGRVLFYDTRMSINNSVSCATCHQQARAFADNVSFSTGFEGKLTFRNSMPIQNLVLTGSPTFILFGPGSAQSDSAIASMPIQFSSDTLSLFWDGRVKLLKAMVLRPITNHVEMGITDLDALALKLSKIPDYQNLFSKAYGTAEVTELKIAGALSAFLQNIKSDNSPFDKIRLGGGTLPPAEEAGHQLFVQKYNCNSCHQVDAALNGYQLGGSFVNIGLDEKYADIGFADVTGNPADVGKFKIPTLRNVALTAPYMHDGRYSTLDEVLEHYSTGIVNHPNLDFRLKVSGNRALQMNITDDDKKSLIVFLNTLTDYNMITDPRFSNPFVSK